MRRRKCFSDIENTLYSYQTVVFLWTSWRYEYQFAENSNSQNTVASEQASGKQMSNVVKERIPNADIRCYSIDIFVKLAGTTRYPYILISHRKALGAEMPLRKKLQNRPVRHKICFAPLPDVHTLLCSVVYLWCGDRYLKKWKQSSIGAIIFIRLFQMYFRMFLAQKLICSARGRCGTA